MNKESKTRNIGGIRENKSKFDEGNYFTGEIKEKDVIWSTNKKGEKVCYFNVSKNKNRTESWHYVYSFYQKNEQERAEVDAPKAQHLVTNDFDDIF